MTYCNRFLLDKQVLYLIMGPIMRLIPALTGKIIKYNFIDTMARKYMSDSLQNMDDLRRRSQEVGEDFFVKTGSDFFCTRVESYLIGYQYFITSELVPDDPSGRDRRYTIRRGGTDGHIETEGEFQAYESIEEARKSVHQLLKSK